MLGATTGRVRDIGGASTLNPQPSTLNPQPSTRNPQQQGGRGTLEGLQPSTLNPQPSTLYPQPSTSTLNPQPSTLNPQLSTLNPQPSTSTLNPQQGGRGTLEGLRSEWSPPGDGEELWELEVVPRPLVTGLL